VLAFESPPETWILTERPGRFRHRGNAGGNLNTIKRDAVQSGQGELEQKRTHDTVRRVPRNGKAFGFSPVPASLAVLEYKRPTGRAKLLIPVCSPSRLRFDTVVPREKRVGSDFDGAPFGISPPVQRSTPAGGKSTSPSSDSALVLGGYDSGSSDSDGVSSRLELLPRGGSLVTAGVARCSPDVEQ
jgi:hypothetical protein